MRRTAICALAATVVTAAGGAAVVQAKTSLSLRADPKGALKYNKTTLRAKPGSVTIRLTNPSSSGKPHALEVEGKGQEKKTRVLNPGKSASLTLTLKRGTYEFYCPVGNHKAAGMKGRLVVK